jgi:hypothetical protein
VSYQNHLNASHHPDGLLSDLTVHFPVHTRYLMRIVEGQGRGFKADAVLAPVDLVVSRIPSKLQAQPL